MLSGALSTALKASAVAALVAIGSTYGCTGDGTMGAASAAGVRNAAFWLQDELKGRLQPVPFPLAANSGTTIARDDGSNTAFIVPIAIPLISAQKPDVFFYLSCGANDNLLSSDPASTPWLQDWKDSVTLAVNSNPQSKLIVICEPGPDTKVGYSTYSATVRAAMAAHSASFRDPRIVHVATGSLVATDWSPSSDASRVHPDERGARAYAKLIMAAIDSRIAKKTPGEILEMMYGGGYPFMQAAQFDSDRALAGSAGTVTNMAGGSVAPTSKLVTNLTGSTAISTGVVATEGSRQKSVTPLGGIVTADNKVMVQDKNNLVFTGATPGAFVRYGFIVRASGGFINAGADLGGFGTIASGANSQPGVVTTAPVADPVDSLWIPYSLPMAGNALQAKRAFAFRYPAGALSGSIETEQWFAWIVSDRLRAPPVYLGGYGIVPTIGKLRVTGTIATTFRVEPGLWNVYGLTEADFAQRRIYKGGDGTIGSGTLVATLSGSTWTATAAAAGIIAGDVLWGEVDCNTGLGGTVTARSATGLTAA